VRHIFDRYAKVISVVLTVGLSLPVYPDEQTSSDRPGMSQTANRRHQYAGATISVDRG
jgi:hypothetical protein